MTDVSELQTALAAEQAIIYGYGVVGAHLHGADRDYATTALQTHMLLRDQLMALIRSSGANPVAARPAYQLPSPVTDPATARELAAHLEQGCAGALWDLIAASVPNGRTRSLAIKWLTESALRGAHWGAQQPLPGQPA